MLLGDFNGHRGNDFDGYECVHGGFGYGLRNAEGERVLDLADSFELKIANKWFKDVEKLVTYESGGHKTVVDYILVKMEEKMKNVKAIACEEVMT